MAPKLDSHVILVCSASQVYVYKLPDLPGASARGYSVTDQPFMPPADSKNPFYGSGGLAATDAADFVYVAAPVAPQTTPQLAALYGNASVFVYKVRAAMLLHHCQFDGRLYDGYATHSGGPWWVRKGRVTCPLVHSCVKHL